MARLEHDGDQIWLRLTRWEKLGAAHRDIAMLQQQVVATREVADLWAELRGMRAPGTGWPGVIMLGTTRFRGGKDFNAVYGHRPGTVIELRGHEFSRVLVSAES